MQAFVRETISGRWQCLRPLSSQGRMASSTNILDVQRRASLAGLKDLKERAELGSWEMLLWNVAMYLEN